MQMTYLGPPRRGLLADNVALAWELALVSLWRPIDPLPSFVGFSFDFNPPSHYMLYIGSLFVNWPKMCWYHIIPLTLHSRCYYNPLAILPSLVCRSCFLKSPAGFHASGDSLAMTIMSHIMSQGSILVLLQVTYLPRLQCGPMVSSTARESMSRWRCRCGRRKLHRIGKLELVIQYYEITELFSQY